ncbi:MAG: 6-bladed beta-propeller [Bryobacterales bacterium]|nr:6-bladed beta-propeller [Bryobacterales bacterium]
MREITWLLLAWPAAAQIAVTAEQATELRQLAANAPKLMLERAELPVGLPMEMVSSVATDGKGTFYLLQRGLRSEPVIAVDGRGRVLRSWGRGLYKIPHSIRVDRSGDVWTTDAASSMVYRFSKEGKKTLEIAVGEIPEGRREFRGTTDIAFGPNGRVFISDGYGNNRVLVYDAKGKRVRQWGEKGIEAGQFHLPHGIAIDERNIVYVADRENGRIQRFDLSGKFLGMWTNLGKTFSLSLQGGALWIGTQPPDEPNGAPGWLMKVDRDTGRVLGAVESTGHHSVAVTADGELLTGTRPDKVLWFRRK